MVSKEDIKSIYLLADLSEQIQEKVSHLTTSRRFEEREVIYEEGDRADNFYMLKRGKILLEVEVAKQIIISLGSIKSGYSFGWSALIPGSNHTSYAVCSEPCDVLITSGEELLRILEEDHAMAYIFMEGMMKVLKKRLDRRTGQFLKVMTKHPDIQKLLGM